MISYGHISKEQDTELKIFRATAFKDGANDSVTGVKWRFRRHEECMIAAEAAAVAGREQVNVKIIDLGRRSISGKYLKK